MQVPDSKHPRRALTTSALMTIALLVLSALGVQALTAQGTYACSEKDLAMLLATVDFEAKQAVAQGYLPVDVGGEIGRSRRILSVAVAERWADGDPRLAEAKARLLRAKGALIRLKLPYWTRDPRYRYGPEADPSNQARWVEWLGNSGPPSPWYTDVESMWCRANCRPSQWVFEGIERAYNLGRPVGVYISGGMMATTYALLPEREEDWADDYSWSYAQNYWRNESRARYWGARDEAEDWGASIARSRLFSRWMMPQVEFAFRIGFDLVHLDECRGRYAEARPLMERNPDSVVLQNSDGRQYVDQEAVRYGFVAMMEQVGSPDNWDNFQARMHTVCDESYNIPWWGYFRVEQEGFLAGLSYATAVANRGSDVAGYSKPPSAELVQFAHRYRDYLLGDYVDAYVDPAVVSLQGAPSAARVVTNRRTLTSGREELVVHILNTDPALPGVEGGRVLVRTTGLRLPAQPVVTFLTPKSAPRVLAAKISDGELSFEMPHVPLWGVVVVGEPLFPGVTTRLVFRGGESVKNPLDNKFVPGEPFEVEVAVERNSAAPHIPKLHVPTGWRSNLLGTTANLCGYRILPGKAELNHGYAITPVITQGGESMPGAPLRLQAQSPVSFRFIAPLVDSPGPGGEYELEVRNNSSAGGLSFSLTAPNGWLLEPGQFKADLASGERRRFRLRLRPPNYHLSFWDQMDASFPLQWTLAGRRGSDKLQVRVFPAQWEVCAEGPDGNLLMMYPGLSSFVGTPLPPVGIPAPPPDPVRAEQAIAQAQRRLKDGAFVVLWLVNQDPKALRPAVERFLKAGGGVVWMGEPFEGDCCPVTAAGQPSTQQSIVYHLGSLQPRNVPDSFAPPGGFRVWSVKVLNWGRAAAHWGQDENAAAVVISTDPTRRIVYIGSDLLTNDESKYDFKSRHNPPDLWYQSRYIYALLNWAAVPEAGER